MKDTAGTWRRKAPGPRCSKAWPVKCSWLVLCLSALLAFTSPNHASAQPATPAGDFKISMDINQVILSVAVRDRSGDLVPDLEQENFQIYEDGEIQEVNFFLRGDIPVTVGLVVDRSRSMLSKWADAVTAAREFARSSNPEDDMFLVSFNEKPMLGLEGEEFTTKPYDLQRALLRHPPDGQTALYDALRMAMGQAAKGRWDKQVLVILSDGGDNASQISLQQALGAVERSHLLVYTVGIYDSQNEDSDPGVLKKLARISGGAAFFPRAVPQVVDICTRIAHDIRNQYMIGYTPANPRPDGKFRKIRVTAASPGSRQLKVRTREGYFPPAEETPPR